MKTILALLLFPLSILAADPPIPWVLPKAATATATAPKPEPQLFRANEVQLDLNGFTRSDDLKHWSQGAGVGLNYFPWREVGFGIDTQTEDVKAGVIDRVGIALIGRMPIEKLHIAPEFKVGYQYDFELGDDTRKYYDAKGGIHQRHVDANGNEVFASIGAEFRFNQHWGVGAEIRGVKPLESKASEYVLGIARVRLNF